MRDRDHDEQQRKLWQQWPGRTSSSACASRAFWSASAFAFSIFAWAYSNRYAFADQQLFFVNSVTGERHDRLKTSAKMVSELASKQVAHILLQVNSGVLGGVASVAQLVTSILHTCPRRSQRHQRGARARAQLAKSLLAANAPPMVRG